MRFRLTSGSGEARRLGRCLRRPPGTPLGHATRARCRSPRSGRGRLGPRPRERPCAALRPALDDDPAQLLRLRMDLRLSCPHGQRPLPRRPRGWPGCSVPLYARSALDDRVTISDPFPLGHEEAPTGRRARRCSSATSCPCSAAGHRRPRLPGARLTGGGDLLALRDRLDQTAPGECLEQLARPWQKATASPTASSSTPAASPKTTPHYGRNAARLPRRPPRRWPRPSRPDRRLARRSAQLRRRRHDEPTAGLRDIDTMAVLVNDMANRPDTEYAGDQRSLYDPFLAGEYGLSARCPEEPLALHLLPELRLCRGDGRSRRVRRLARLRDRPAAVAGAGDGLADLRVRHPGELYYQTTSLLPTAWTDSFRPAATATARSSTRACRKAARASPRSAGGKDIPIDSIRMKRIRDGREDFEYLQMLSGVGRAASGGGGRGIAVRPARRRRCSAPQSPKTICQSARLQLAADDRAGLRMKVAYVVSRFPSRLGDLRPARARRGQPPTRTSTSRCSRCSLPRDDGRPSGGGALGRRGWTGRPPARSRGLASAGWRGAARLRLLVSTVAIVGGDRRQAADHGALARRARPRRGARAHGQARRDRACPRPLRHLPGAYRVALRAPGRGALQLHRPRARHLRPPGDARVARSTTRRSSIVDLRVQSRVPALVQPRRDAGRGRPLRDRRRSLSLPAHEPGPPPARVSLLCVAALRESKGHAMLLRALAGGGERLEQLSIDLVGDGPLRPELEAAADRPWASRPGPVPRQPDRSRRCARCSPRRMSSSFPASSPPTATWRASRWH